MPQKTSPKAGGGRKPPQPPRYPLPQLETEPLPIDHYDPFGPEEPCECWLCKEWNTRLWECDAASKETTGHPRSCMCDKCRERRRREIRLLVAENIRDLWTELCWAAWMENWDESWIRWWMEELAAPDRTIGFWSSQITHFPMAYWYARWDSWRTSRGIGEHLKPVQANIKNL